MFVNIGGYSQRESSRVNGLMLTFNNMLTYIGLIDIINLEENRRDDCIQRLFAFNYDINCYMKLANQSNIL